MAKVPLTISIEDERAAALDRVAAKAYNGNRSAAVDAAIDPLLEKFGELPGAKSARVRTKADLVMEILGDDVAEAEFDRLIRGGAREAASAGGKSS
jgi:hypothetical protein